MDMEHEFIKKLDLKNLLYLHGQICSAISNKDANEVIEHLKRLETQKKHCRNNKEYKLLEKDCKILEDVINFNCL